jgi:hypothetical protein
MWQGGRAPFGYDIGDRRLVTNKADAAKALEIFTLYLEIGSVNKLKKELQLRDIKSRQRTSQRGRKYGGEYFSRGALHALLMNPVYTGQISHKGILHEGLHDAIIPQKLWEAVQEKLQSNAADERGSTKQRHKNMLTGLIFDEKGHPFTSVFTDKKGRKYRYYFNERLGRDKAHPDKTRSRFPAHEIEKVIEASLRRKLRSFLADAADQQSLYFLHHQQSIPAYDLVRALIIKVIVHQERLEITLNSAALDELVKKHLDLNLTYAEKEAFMVVPYQSLRAQDGIMITNPEGKNDIFDLPSKAIKKLIQGIVWRDEHFDGTALKTIAKRENCSQDYVGSAIFYSFKTLESAF